jgi:hypothetical protein
VGLERGLISRVSTTEELLGRKSSESGLENRDYGRRDPSRLPCGTLNPQMLALTTPKNGGRSVGRVRSRTQAMEYFTVTLTTKQLPHLSTLSELQVKVTLETKFSWPVSLNVKPNLRSKTTFLLLSVANLSTGDALSEERTGINYSGHSQ